MSHLDSENIDIEKIRLGDTLEFEKLYRHFFQSFVLFANKYVYDLEVAENIVQDVFINVWQNRSNLEPSRNIKTYLYTSVKNHALNYLKHQKVERSYKETIQIEERDDLTPETLFRLKELELQVNKALKDLTEKRRRIFLMSRNDHLSYAEIAEILGVSIKTVENQMGKALKTLRSYLTHFLSSLF